MSSSYFHIIRDGHSHTITTTQYDHYSAPLASLKKLNWSGFTTTCHEKMVRYPPQKGALGTGQPYKVLNWSWQWQSTLCWLPIANQPRNCTGTHGQTQTEKRKQKKMEAALQRDTIFHCDQSCLSVEMVYHGKLQSDQFWQMCVILNAKLQFVHRLAKAKTKQKQFSNTTEGTNFPRR